MKPDTCKASLATKHNVAAPIGSSTVKPFPPVAAKNPPHPQHLNCHFLHWVYVFGRVLHKHSYLAVGPTLARHSAYGLLSTCLRLSLMDVDH
jgi:hypothetical protein